MRGQLSKTISFVPTRRQAKDGGCPRTPSFLGYPPNGASASSPTVETITLAVARSSSPDFTVWPNSTPTHLQDRLSRMTPPPSLWHMSTSPVAPARHRPRSVTKRETLFSASLHGTIPALCWYRHMRRSIARLSQARRPGLAKRIRRRPCAQSPSPAIAPHPTESPANADRKSVV